MLESRLFEVGGEPLVSAEQGEPLAVRPGFALGFQSDLDLQHVSVGDAENPPRAESDHHRRPPRARPSCQHTTDHPPIAMIAIEAPTRNVLSPPTVGPSGDSARGEPLLRQLWCSPGSTTTPRFR